MSREQRIAYPNPPLAGRPPFATDEPDSIYQTGPSVQAYYRQHPPPNIPTSVFTTNDTHLDPSYQDERDLFSNSTYAVGSSNQRAPIPLAAPRPGYAAPIDALNLARPSPTATPDGRMGPDMSQMHTPIPIGVPSTPHPLQAPLIPIAPVFAKPSRSPALRDVKFTLQKPIMRGDKEETILPKRGEKGDDFWRRFSIVVQEEKKTHNKPSNWLKETQNGSSQLIRWVWVAAFFLLVGIAGASFLGWYISHKSSNHSIPEAVGGGADEHAGPTTMSSSSSLVAGGIATSGSLHVSPTLTLNDKRETLSPPSPLDYRAFRTNGRLHQRSRPRRNHGH